MISNFTGQRWNDKEVEQINKYLDERNINLKELILQVISGRVKTALDKELEDKAATLMSKASIETYFSQSNEDTLFTQGEQKTLKLLEIIENMYLSKYPNNEKVVKLFVHTREKVANIFSL